jgi:hypothetical protein
VRVFFLPVAGAPRFGLLPTPESLRLSDSSKINWRWILESLLILLAVAILPVIIGILLDWRLHTSPIITLAMMFLGFNIGIVAIYRRVAVIYMQISPPDKKEIPNTSEEIK